MCNRMLLQIRRSSEFPQALLAHIRLIVNMNFLVPFEIADLCKSLITIIVITLVRSISFVCPLMLLETAVLNEGFSTELLCADGELSKKQKKLFIC